MAKPSPTRTRPAAVPARPTAPQTGGELESAEDGVGDRADDVHDHRHG